MPAVVDSPITRSYSALNRSNRRPNGFAEMTWVFGSESEFCACVEGAAKNATNINTNTAFVKIEDILCIFIAGTATVNWKSKNSSFKDLMLVV